MSEIIGMMEGAFFVSRGELIQWINETFQLNITKIEQLGSGAVYCQILDVIHPGKVNMAKVNWKAQLEWEFINNLKILQQSFLKCGLNKHIDVEKLAKAKYQDNLEFAQWMKRYYDLNGGSNKDYDPVARRGHVEPNFGFGGDKHVPAKTKQEDKTVAMRHRSKEKGNGRFETKPRHESVPKKTQKFTSDKDAEKELRSIYQYLLSMKAVADDRGVKNEEKVEIISDLLANSLKLPIFDEFKGVSKQQNSNKKELSEEARLEKINEEAENF